MNYLFERDRKYALLLFLLILVMFSIGMLAIFKYRNYFLLGDINNLDNDDVRYLNTAYTLLKEKKLIYYGNESTMFIMPGYPFFMALSILLFKNINSIVCIRVTQLVLQCLSLYILYFISREFFNKKVAIISCFLTIIYIPEYMVSNLILTEALYKFLYLLLLYVSLIAIEKNKRKFYILGGVIWSLVCLVRPNAAIFPLFILILWIFKRYKIRDMIKYSLIVIAIFFLMFSPWIIRNYNISKEFVLFTQSSANPKLLGAFIRWGEPDFAKEIPANYKYEEFINKEYLTEEEQNNLANYLIKTGFEKQPLKYSMWYTLGKTKELYKKPYYWKPIFRVSEENMQYIHTLYMGLGLIGFLLMILKKEKKGAKLIILLLINTISSLPFITFDRYGYVNMFIFIISAAYVLSILFCKENNKRNLFIN